MPWTRTPTPETPWALDDERKHIVVLHPPIQCKPSRQLAIDHLGQLVLPDELADTCGMHHLRIYREGEPPPPSPAWLWNGDEQHPTLRPSIRCLISGWHGFLTDGRMIACGDSA